MTTFKPESVSSLNDLIFEVFAKYGPAKEDFEKKLQTAKEIKETLEKNTYFGTSQVKIDLFGSLITNSFCKYSDFDLVAVSHDGSSVEEPEKLLLLIENVLESELDAKVNNRKLLLQCYLNKVQTKVDVTANNIDGLKRTILLRSYFQRFPYLIPCYVFLKHLFTKLGLLKVNGVNSFKLAGLLLYFSSQSEYITEMSHHEKNEVLAQYQQAGSVVEKADFWLETVSTESYKVISAETLVQDFLHYISNGSEYSLKSIPDFCSLGGGTLFCNEADLKYIAGIPSLFNVAYEAVTDISSFVISNATQKLVPKLSLCHVLIGLENKVYVLRGKARAMFIDDMKFICNKLSEPGALVVLYNPRVEQSSHSIIAVFGSAKLIDQANEIMKDILVSKKSLPSNPHSKSAGLFRTLFEDSRSEYDSLFFSKYLSSMKRPQHENKDLWIPKLVNPQPNNLKRVISETRREMMNSINMMKEEAMRQYNLVLLDCMAEMLSWSDEAEDSLVLNLHNPKLNIRLGTFYIANLDRLGKGDTTNIVATIDECEKSILKGRKKFKPITPGDFKEINKPKPVVFKATSAPKKKKKKQPPKGITGAFEPNLTKEHVHNIMEKLRQQEFREGKTRCIWTFKNAKQRVEYKIRFIRDEKSPSYHLSQVRAGNRWGIVNVIRTSGLDFRVQVQNGVDAPSLQANQLAEPLKTRIPVITEIPADILNSTFAPPSCLMFENADATPFYARLQFAQAFKHPSIPFTVRISRVYEYSKVETMLMLLKQGDKFSTSIRADVNTVCDNIEELPDLFIDMAICLSR